MTQPKLKIVFLDYILDLNKPGETGLSDLVWDMATELVEMGHDVHIVGPYPAELAPHQRVTLHSIKVPPTGYRWFGGHLWICKRMAQVAARLQPDIIHAPEYVSTAVYNTLYPPNRVPGPFRRFLFGQAAPTLRVLTVPGNIFHRIRSNGNPFSYFYTQCLKWAALKTVKTGTLVITPSPEMKQAWEETGSSAENTFLIGYGTNAHLFHEIPDARVILGLDPKATILLYVGRFSQEKAVIELIDTLAQSQQQLRQGNVKVQMFGRGPQAALADQKLEQAGLSDIVTHLEWTDLGKLPLWYSAADALLLPSYSEGFARVILQSLSCGTPVIGSRISGTKDAITDGQTGYLFEPGKFDELRAIFERVAADPLTLRRLRDDIKLHAQTNLSWRSVMSRIVEEVYRPNLAQSADNKSLQPALQGEY